MYIASYNSTPSVLMLDNNASGACTLDVSEDPTIELILTLTAPNYIRISKIAKRYVV